jgi:hypothetical protein
MPKNKAAEGCCCSLLIFLYAESPERQNSGLFAFLQMLANTASWQCVEISRTRALDKSEKNRKAS